MQQWQHDPPVEARTTPETCLEEVVTINKDKAAEKKRLQKQRQSERRDAEKLAKKAEEQAKEAEAKDVKKAAREEQERIRAAQESVVGEAEKLRRLAQAEHRKEKHEQKT